MVLPDPVIAQMLHDRILWADLVFDICATPQSLWRTDRHPLWHRQLKNRVLLISRTVAQALMQRYAPRCIRRRLRSREVPVIPGHDKSGHPGRCTEFVASQGAQGHESAD